MNGNANELWSEIRRIDAMILKQNGDISVIKERTHTIAQSIAKLADEKVNIERFHPVEKLAYGAAALILSGVCGALLMLVLQSS